MAPKKKELSSQGMVFTSKKWYRMIPPESSQELYFYYRVL